MTLTARDVYGNQLVTGGTSISTWAVSLTGPATLSASSIVYAGSGRYTATFTPTLAGRFDAAPPWRHAPSPRPDIACRTVTRRRYR